MKYYKEIKEKIIKNYSKKLMIEVVKKYNERIITRTYEVM